MKILEGIVKKSQEYQNPSDLQPKKLTMALSHHKNELDSQ